ncbi:hypothetical protein LTR56_001864 [Elasticomyces elasticus]|nr:hypothetical protein LTR56_001864 [Elasticomyces elasticus]KAK3668785.1 hypothetical protein LTR22_000265 [Elasticomyces elasticus]KAK4909009.1 hypothetical protein LTR49_022163 [Elasticomyces elasticus]KAK5757944.1 hypothetical protein LTS12_011983 [Elasticomyces elasticus]
MYGQARECTRDRALLVETTPVVFTQQSFSIRTEARMRSPGALCDSMGWYRGLRELLSTVRRALSSELDRILDAATTAVRNETEVWTRVVETSIAAELQEIITEFNHRFDKKAPINGATRKFNMELLATVEQAKAKNAHIAEAVAR